MLEAFEKHITTQFPFLKKGSFLIACSGGLDSVVLTHLFHYLKLNFSLAHCNYNLRGDDSKGDQQFVEALAANMQRNVHTISFAMDKHLKNENSSVQLVARNLRYEWFNSLATEYGYDYILTAHHADDSLETFLINLSRGTGIKGLTGILEQNKNVVRPLLAFSRQEILEFANLKQLQWREDSSNSETKYLRNRVRHKVVPSLKELHSGFLENFKLTQQHLLGTSNLIEAYADQLKEVLFKKEDEIIHISVDTLKQKKPLREHLHLLFEPYGFTQWNDIAKLLETTSGKTVYSKTHQLVKNRNTLLLKELKEIEQIAYSISQHEKLLVEPFKMTMESVSAISNSKKSVLFVDGQKLKYPLLLRKWNTGDYFYPLGMKGKKKLSKFFKDEKIDILSKKNIWLLCSGNEIVWVVGKRADERFKVTKNTSEILKFELY